MLTLYHNNQEIPLDTTEYYVRELASGLDEVIFDLSIWDPAYAIMAEEENIVDRGDQKYLIKQIDAGAVTAKVVCQLDLDEWKANMLVGYYSGSLTVAQQINAVKPTGWSVLDFSGVSISRTIEGDYTPLQVCERCREVYEVYIRWDNKAKTCSIYSQQMGSPVGAFATRELNLKEINYKGKSTDFATRLYAYGKDGLSFASINSGKPYVDNNTYSSRIISAYWQDDRYTDAASLKAAAEKNLAKLAVPERSYDCAIIDLQATNPELYNNLDFSLFTAATLIDDVKGTAIDYQVVERHVWPYHPDHNDVIFNSAPVKIQNTVIQIEDEINNPQSDFRQLLEAEINLVTDWLTDNQSHCYITQNSDGTIKDFIFVNGDQPIQTATQVMRINASGLGFSKTGVNGPYTNAFVFDSTKGGHLVADFITAGTLTANLIKAGILADVAGVNYINMTTGEVSLGSTTEVGGKTVDTIATEKASAAATALSNSLDATNVFNRLTNNGQRQGLFTQTDSQGNVNYYFNGSHIATGSISDANMNTVFNLASGALTSNKLSITSPNFTLTEQGVATLVSAVLTNATITSASDSSLSPSSRVVIGAGEISVISAGGNRIDLVQGEIQTGSGGAIYSSSGIRNSSSFCQVTDTDLTLIANDGDGTLWITGDIYLTSDQVQMMKNSSLETAVDTNMVVQTTQGNKYLRFVNGLLVEERSV